MIGENSSILPKVVLENKLEKRIIRIINKKCSLTNILNLTKPQEKLPTGLLACRAKQDKTQNLHSPFIQPNGPKGPSITNSLQTREIILKVTGTELLQLLHFKNRQANAKGQFYKIFRGKDHKIAVEKETDIYHIANYIFLNAHKRKLCQKPKSYPYQGGRLLNRLAEEENSC